MVVCVLERFHWFWFISLGLGWATGLCRLWPWLGLNLTGFGLEWLGLCRLCIWAGLNLTGFYYAGYVMLVRLDSYGFDCYLTGLDGLWPWGFLVRLGYQAF